MLLLVWGWEAVGPGSCAAEMFQCFLSVAARILPVSAGTWRPLLWGWGWRRLAGQEDQGLISFALRPSGAPGQRHHFHKMME